jgi:hypothetical protein
VREALAKKYTLLEEGNPSADELLVGTQNNSPAYKPTGYTFYTNYNGGSTLMITTPGNNANAALPKQIDIDVRSEVVKVYTELGLAKTDTRQISGSGEQTDVYTNEDLICTIEAPDSPVSGAVASCGELDKYDEAAAAMKPFADILPNVGESSGLFNLHIADSATPGHQKAWLDLANLAEGGGVLSLFYKKDGGEWQFFKNTQEAPLCSDFNTDDLKNAFRGQTCFDENGNDLTVE